MKNKILLVFIISVFLILINGCSKNLKTENNNESESPLEEKYEIKDIKMGINEDGQFSVHGRLRNMGSEKKYTEISIPCYNKNKEKTGEATDSISSIESKGEWKFRAVYIGGNMPANCDVNMAEVTAY
jgi:hypothetical protein